MRGFVLAIDVGGTGIKAGIVTENHTLLGNDIRHFPSRADASFEDFVDHLVDLIRSMRNAVPELTPLGIGVGFPGPFDYEEGVSLIQGLGKFDQLYGKPLRITLESRLKAAGLLLPGSRGVRFANDAEVFALGESLSGLGKDCERMIALTLGTGCGSAFLVSGRVQREGKGIPPEGMLYHLPFRDGIVDDYISRRWLLGQMQGKAWGDEVLSIAVAAQMGNLEARRVFMEYGSNLGAILAPWLRDFDPQVVVLGGKIARAHPWFGSGLAAASRGSAKLFRPSWSTDRSALIGAAELIWSQGWSASTPTARTAHSRPDIPPVQPRDPL